MKNIIIAIVAIVLVVLGISWAVLNNEPVFEGTTNFDSLTLSENLTVAGTAAITGAVTLTGDTTVSGGTLNVTTANTATSTLVVGCIQFYATSTATALRFQASTTPGIMYSAYGTCPNL